MYDENSGQRIVRGPNKDFVPRGKSPTPCWSCPKGSPAEAPQHELSTRNRLAYRYYLQARAPLGERLPADTITHRVLATIDRLVRASEAGRAASSLAESLLVASVQAKAPGKRR